MANDKPVAKATPSAVPAATAAVGEAPAAKEKQVVQLYLLKPWTTGTGHTYPVTAEGAPPVEFDFGDLPDGVDASAFDYLIATGAAESAAMRAANRKAAR